jgi:putative endonuclease
MSGSGIANRPTSVTAGSSAEDIACGYLEKRGLRLVARNYRCRTGEIDLIMRDGEDLVFVEVRYRKYDAFGSAAETVSSAKRTRIVTTAACYLQRQPVEPPCRFDVVAIGGEAPHRIEWIRDAFQ